MYFQHIYDKSLSQGSYFIGCQKCGVAMVIDPKRDVDTYLHIAKQHNMRITHVAETHIHADFLCGSRELAALTGAGLFLSDEGGPDWKYEFAHQGLRHGDLIEVGNLKFEVIHTPGHTPESICFLLTDTAATDKPVMLFTGDFVFVGDIGRPDLLEKAAGFKGTQRDAAHQMYASLRKFSALPDYIQLWPGHGAGSACGKSLGSVPGSTVGYEKFSNWAFQFASDEKGFVDYLLEDQPEPPRYFAQMKKLNRVDRRLLTEIPKVKKLSGAEMRTALNNGVQVIDTRPKTQFAKGFIPGSINIQGNNSFSTWMGWFVSYDKPFILVAETAKLEDLTRKLMRIGLDNIHGYIDVIDQSTEGRDSLAAVDLLSLKEFKKILRVNHTQIIDLRSASEYKSAHIKGTQNLFVGDLEKNLSKIKKDEPVVLHCQSGDRATIGYSILAKHGFKNVKNFAGGMQEWTQAGNPVETSA